jgi:hypothetical protein
VNGIPPSETGTRFKPSLLLALTTTSFLVLVPLVAAWAVQIYAPAYRIPLSIGAGMLVSIGLSWLATALWARSPFAGERVFGDITLLGHWRFNRATKQIAQLESVMADHQTVTDEQARRTMMQLADALERRDQRTHGHSRRVARHAAAIATEMGLPAEDVARIRFAGAMHDIGKLRVPIEILFKPGKLTPEEFDLIKRHPVDSASLVGVIGDPALIAIIRGHHERWDGGGYPDNLAGEQIPLGARIIAVADTFDALVSDRAYRDASTHGKARTIIAEASGSQFDPRVAEAFRQYYRGGNWHVAWGAIAALPPRAATLIGDLIRGGIPAATVAPAVAAMAIATAGLTAVGGLPNLPGRGTLNGQSHTALATLAPGLGSRMVKLRDGRSVQLPDGVTLNDRGVAVDASGNPVDLTHGGSALHAGVLRAEAVSTSESETGSATSGESQPSYSGSAQRESGKAGDPSQRAEAKTDSGTKTQTQAKAQTKSKTKSKGKGKAGAGSDGSSGKSKSGKSDGNSGETGAGESKGAPAKSDDGSGSKGKGGGKPQPAAPADGADATAPAPAPASAEPDKKKDKDGGPGKGGGEK